MRAFFRLLIVLIILLYFFVVSLRIQALPTHRQVHYIRQFHRLLSSALGLDIKFSGAVPSTPSLVVANHISWHDVFAIGCYCQPDFVAKAEIASMPLIGTMAKRGGTIYIKRGDRKIAHSIARTIADTLKKRSVLVFPEGTTSEGKVVQPFKRRLFESAYLANCLIQPVALHLSLIHI